MEKIILYYKFVPVADPNTVMFWQRTLCEKLNLRGRIIISKHGINGTLGGDVSSLKQYVKEMNVHPDFKKIPYKWSDGGAADFPRLSVKVRDEIVAFDAADEIEVDENGVIGGGEHLTPQALHELIEDRGEEIIFYDGRNAYEADVGRFQGAIVPNAETTRDFKRDIESGEISKFKDRPIVTYCTGGIRCEILSSLMKKRGYQEVYQIDGGIVKYGEQFGNDGFWDGKLYVFDERMVVAFDESAEDLGECIHCQQATSRFVNCANKQCNKLMLICEGCSDDVTCQTDCRKQLMNNTLLTK